jgi:hypothetical protein
MTSVAGLALELRDNGGHVGSAAIPWASVTAGWGLPDEASHRRRWN